MLPLLASIVHSVAAEAVVLATFDGAPATTHDWSTQNDPVMGGISQGICEVASSEDVMVFLGSVENVPGTSSAGFASCRTAGRTAFPDLSSTAALELSLRVVESELTTFEVQLGTLGGRTSS